MGSDLQFPFADIAFLRLNLAQGFKSDPKFIILKDRERRVIEPQALLEKGSVGAGRGINC